MATDGIFSRRRGVAIKDEGIKEIIKREEKRRQRDILRG